MNRNATLAIEHFTVLFTDTMIHLLQVTSPPLDTSFFAGDRRQFEQIDAQLRMIMATRPIHPWAAPAWRQNLVPLLAQALRQSRHCLQKLMGITRNDLLPGFITTPNSQWLTILPLIARGRRMIASSQSGSNPRRTSL